MDFSVAIDVTNERAITTAVNDATQALGGVDSVVACAGVPARGTVLDTSLEEWQRVFAVNVEGVFLTAKASIPHLRRAGGGAIVIVASQLGIVAAAAAAAYCASKGAVIHLTRAMAVDHGPEGIRVNCVCPGPTETPLLEHYFSASVHAAEERRNYERAQLNGRFVRPDEVADAIAYLLSPRATSTMGAALVVDGGYTIR
jgi:NAD(P)-dependent dehydrogenase (short-subunit alcohol dehydrogenase family)